MMFTEIVLGGTSTDFYFHLPRVFVHIPSVLPALCVCVFWAFATIYFPKSTAGLIEIKQKKKGKKDCASGEEHTLQNQQRQDLQ